MMPANTAPDLDLTSPDRRNRLTVGFRSLLVIPQTIAVTVLGLIASAAIFVGWFAALATGRIPTWAWTFTAQVTAYQVRVSAYQYLLVDEYPPFAFTAPDVTNYPVQLDLPEQGRLSRVKVLFRIILAIPATIVFTTLNWGWIACGFFIWLAVLITGRTPQPVLDAVSAMLRYQLRYNAWLNLLTDKRPKELFGDKNPTAERHSATRPLILSRGGRRLLITFIVVGVLAYLSYNLTNTLVIQPMLQDALLQQMEHMPR